MWVLPYLGTGDTATLQDRSTVETVASSIVAEYLVRKTLSPRALAPDCDTVGVTAESSDVLLYSAEGKSLVEKASV